MEDLKNIISNIIEYGNIKIIVPKDNFEYVYEVKGKFVGFDIKLYKETFISENELKREFINEEDCFDFFANLLTEILLNKNSFYIDYDITIRLKSKTEKENLISILAPMLETLNNPANILKFYKNSFTGRGVLYLKEKYKKSRLIYDLSSLFKQFAKVQDNLEIIKTLVNIIYFSDDEKAIDKANRKLNEFCSNDTENMKLEISFECLKRFNENIQEYDQYEDVSRLIYR